MDWRNEVEALTQKGQIKMPYTWSVGETGSRFLIALRDEQKILANRCPQCGTVYVPPRKNCGRCFCDIGAEDWLELGNEGAVTAFTVVRYAYPLQPVARRLRMPSSNSMARIIFSRTSSTKRMKTKSKLVCACGRSSRM